MKAFAYARFSSDQQREESIDAQLRAIREYADKNKIEIVREYTDEAKSATSDKRPAFQRMFEDLPLFRPDCVIVHKLDRFSRDRYDSAYYRRIIKKNGGKLISVLEPLDDSPESVILESVLEGMAEYYSKNLARETLKGLKETAYQCKHTGGTPPLGYDVDSDSRYVINPFEADTVRKIFSLYAAGKSYDQILGAIKDRRTKFGKPFGKNSLNSILRNEKYTGTYIFGLQKRSNHNSHKKEPNAIRIPEGMPRIISDEMWIAAQARLNDSKRKAVNKAKRTYLLSGEIICPKCGAIMAGATTVNPRGYEHSYYGCTTKQRTKGCDQKNIPAEKIESAVLELVEEKLRPDQEMAEAILEILNAEDPNVKEYLKELEETEKKQARLISMVESGGDFPSVMARLGELSNKEKTLRQMIAEARKAEVDLKTVKEFLASMTDLKSLPRERQREIINRVVDKIKISETHIDVEFRILMVAGVRNAQYKNFILCCDYIPLY